jgi:hypothetical protein
MTSTVIIESSRLVQASQREQIDVMPLAKGPVSVTAAMRPV